MIGNAIPGAQLNPNEAPPSLYGYGPRPDDPLCTHDTPSLSGELGLTENELTRLMDTVMDLETRLESMLGPDEGKVPSALGIAEPPLPAALAQIRQQRRTLQGAVDRLRSLYNRVAI